MRVCRRPAQIAGHPIGAGEHVLVGVASANRDEAVFEDADTFRLDRGLPRHLSFSGGAHHCVGARLARLVACETVSTFVRRFDVGQVRLARDYRFEGVPVFLEWGPATLAVEVEATASA